MKLHPWIAARAACFAFGVAASVSFARQYQITEITSGATNGDWAAVGLNNTGQVVGWSVVGGVDCAFLWTPTSPNGTTGSITLLPSVGSGLGAAAYGINDAGDVVGWAVQAFTDPEGNISYVPIGAVWRAGALESLLTYPGYAAFGHGAHAINESGDVAGWFFPGGMATGLIWPARGAPIPTGGHDALAINESGLAVGTTNDGFGGTYGYWWIDDGQSARDLYPGRVYSQLARDVNDAGVVVGANCLGTCRNAVYWPSPQSPPVVLPILPLATTMCTGVNNAGDIVGISDAPFVWRAGIVTRLQDALFDPGDWVLDFPPKDINDAGQIVGLGRHGGNRCAYLLTPCAGGIAVQPEPATTCPAGSALFSVTSTGTQPFTYQWRIEDSTAPGGWNDLADGPLAGAAEIIAFVTGSRAPTLVFDLTASEEVWNHPGFVFDCKVTNACGTAVSARAALTITPCDCIDFNNDDIFPDIVDLEDFLNVFAGGACSNDPNCADIDFNNDQIYPDNTDLELFLFVFSGGSC